MLVTDKKVFTSIELLKMKHKKQPIHWERILFFAGIVANRFVGPSH